MDQAKILSLAENIAEVAGIDLEKMSEKVSSAPVIGEILPDLVNIGLKIMKYTSEKKDQA